MFVRINMERGKIMICYKRKLGKKNLIGGRYKFNFFPFNFYDFKN